MAFVCWSGIDVNIFLATLLGNENLAIMTDSSSSNGMMALEALLEKLHKGIDIHIQSHCYRVMEQGIIMMKISVINELRMYDLPKHSKSIASAISGLLNFVDDQINRNKSVDPIHVIQKSAIEKLTDNPCNDLPTCDVVGQDELRSFQAEIVDPKSLTRA